MSGDKREEGGSCVAVGVGVKDQVPFFHIYILYFLCFMFFKYCLVS